MDVYRFGATGAMNETKLLNIADHFQHVRTLIPMTDGIDLTTLSEAQFLAAITGRYNVQGFGASNSERAFRAPMMDLGENGIGSLKSVLQNAGQKVKDAVKKVGDNIKAAFQQLTNWIFKGPLQKAAPMFIYAFVKDAPTAKIAKKKANQLKIIDFIANATGAKRETVMTTIAAAITAQKGQTPAQLLNAVAGKTIAGDGTVLKSTASVAALALGVPPGVTNAIIEIIQKIVAVFKKDKSEVPDATDAAPAATDFDGVTETGNLSTDTTTAPTENGGRVTLPTPPAANEVEKETAIIDKTLPKPSGKDNTMLYVGAAAVVALVLMNK